MLKDEEIFNLRQEGKSYKEISAIDGRNAKTLSSRYCRFCQSKGIDISKVSVELCRKIREKTEEQAEDIAKSIANQRMKATELSSLIVQKTLDIIAEKGDTLTEASLNILANILAKIDTYVANRELINPIQDSLKPDNLDAIAEGYGLKDYKR